MMTEIEKKALALVNEIAATRGTSWPCVDRKNDSRWEALCRAIEQHEAFRREVSDAVEDYCGYVPPDSPCHPITRFIIPKPVDPLIGVCEEAIVASHEETAKNLRAAMKARGYEITKIGEGA